MIGCNSYARMDKGSFNDACYYQVVPRCRPIRRGKRLGTA